MAETPRHPLDQQYPARFLPAAADTHSGREPIAIIGMGCRKL
jgi:hypothetical protein